MAAEFARPLPADAHIALSDGYVFFVLGVAAAVAGVFRPQVGATDAAVHATWGDEVLGDPLFH